VAVYFPPLGVEKPAPFVKIANGGLDVSEKKRVKPVRLAGVTVTNGDFRIIDCVEGLMNPP
jgi:hypothetical protein